jgi:hypothetical protein
MKGSPPPADPPSGQPPRRDRGHVSSYCPAHSPHVALLKSNAAACVAVPL